LEQKFHDRASVINGRAFRHILLVKDSCSARDSVNGTEVAFLKLGADQQKAQGK